MRLAPSAPRFACVWCQCFTAPVTLQDQGIETCSRRRRYSRPLAHRAPANRRYPAVSRWQRGKRAGTWSCPTRWRSPDGASGGYPLSTQTSSQRSGLSHRRPTPRGLTAEAVSSKASRPTKSMWVPDGAAAHQSPGLKANPVYELTTPAVSQCPRSAKGFRPLKGHLIPHDVIAGPS